MSGSIADKMNALDKDMFDALVATSERLSREKGLRAVVISGAGRAFCAGLDMGNFSRMEKDTSVTTHPGPAPDAHHDAQVGQARLAMDR